MILSYEHIDSTNRVARELALEGCAGGTVVQASSQSSGRGQYGREFSSPPGGLYFTLVLVPDLPVSALPLVTLATGVACRETICAATGLQPLIKWPNDLFLGERKVAGILCESVLLPGDRQAARVLIGVGVNVNSRVGDFPEEVRPLVTTLREHLAAPLALPELLQRFTESIATRVTMLRDRRSAVLAEWQRYDFLVGREIVCTAGTTVLEGMAVGLDDAGCYRLRDRGGLVHAIVGGQIRPRAPSATGPDARSLDSGRPLAGAQRT